MFDAIVVGAGVSGLCAAHELRRAGLSVLVVEAGARPGGVIGSVAREGCLYEIGPNSAMDTSPLIGELVETLGLRSRWRLASDASSANRFVVRDGRLNALPMSPGAFFSTPLFSAAAKFRLMREPFVARGDAKTEESIAAFVRRRLGPEFLDYAIDPFVAGIYAGDPERISVPAAFPKLHALEQRWGSLIKGAILGAKERRKQKETAKNSAKSFSFDGGMQVLTDALAAAVGPLALRARALRIEPQREDEAGAPRFTLHAQGLDGACSWTSRAIVLAVPADAAAALLREHVPDAAAALDGIDYAPVATVASAYTRGDIGHALNGFGALLPRKEQRQALGVLFSSTMFEGRAPAGTALLTSFLGGRRNPALPAKPEADIAAAAMAEHVALLGAKAPPRWQAVTRWPRAIPQYELGHLQRVARAEAAEQALPGLFLLGNWKGGVAVGDCIVNGRRCGEAAAARLMS